jgi:hypothetical protein
MEFTSIVFIQNYREGKEGEERKKKKKEKGGSRNNMSKDIM